MLQRCGSGFGALALAALLREPAFGAVLGDATAEPERGPGRERRPFGFGSQLVGAQAASLSRPGRPA